MERVLTVCHYPSGSTWSPSDPHALVASVRAHLSALAVKNPALVGKVAGDLAEMLLVPPTGVLSFSAIPLSATGQPEIVLGESSPSSAHQEISASPPQCDTVLVPGRPAKGTQSPMSPVIEARDPPVLHTFTLLPGGAVSPPTLTPSPPSSSPTHRGRIGTLRKQSQAMDDLDPVSAITGLCVEEGALARTALGGRSMLPDEAGIVTSTDGTVTATNTDNDDDAKSEDSSDDVSSADTVISRSAVFEEDELGNDMVNDYVLWEELGEGACGKVFLGIDNNTGEQRAIKMIDRRHVPRMAAGGNEMESLLDEVTIMKNLRHRHIVALYECIDDPLSEAVYLVMQFVGDGAVAAIDSEDGSCGRVETDTLNSYALQLASALRYLHNDKRKVVHGDIKPDNILRDGDNVYLADFGVSKTFLDTGRAPDALTANESGDKKDRSCLSDSSIDYATPALAKKKVVGGTPMFLSPECITGEEPGPEADMWALGVTLYAMLYGRLPFFAADYAGLTKQILYAPLNFPPVLDPKVRMWEGPLRALLRRDKTLRMTADELCRVPMLRTDDGRGHSVLEDSMELSLTERQTISPMTLRAHAQPPLVNPRLRGKKSTGAVRAVSCGSMARHAAVTATPPSPRQRGAMRMRRTVSARSNSKPLIHQLLCGPSDDVAPAAPGPDEHPCLW